MGAMPPERPSDPAARHDGWGTLKRFLPYLWPRDNPALRLSAPGREKKLPQVLSLDEVDRLLEAARDKANAASDAKSVTLKFDGLARHRVYRISFPKCDSTDGSPLQNKLAYYTVNAVPD